MNILGIDPSLRSCGAVLINAEKKILLSATFGYSLENANELDKIKRNLVIAQEIVRIGKVHKIDYVGMEGSAINKRMGNQLMLLELHGVIKSQIFLGLHKVPIIVPPPSWKKEIIGHGMAKKKDIAKKLKDYQFENEKVVQDLYDALGVALYIHRTKGLIESKGRD